MGMLQPAPVIYVVEPFGGSIRRHNPSLPLVFWDDAAVTRGDGVFESLLIRDGKARNTERHAQRFARSARALGLPEPCLDKWLEATALAASEFDAEEAKCTWTYSRGRASTGVPTAWVVVQPIGADVIAQRAKGVRVWATPRRWQADDKVLAKTLNYAATLATLRQARHDGYDDVIYTHPDSGLVLEGATSTVVAVRGKKLRTPKAPGILPGTTQAAIFALAEDRGYNCKAKEMDLGYLQRSDSVWLVSSVRTGVRVRSLNGTKLAAPDNAEEIRALIDAAVAS